MCVRVYKRERERDGGFLLLTTKIREYRFLRSNQKNKILVQDKKSFRSKMSSTSELGALPPGWDTKFDPRTGR